MKSGWCPVYVCGGAWGVSEVFFTEPLCPCVIVLNTLSKLCLGTVWGACLGCAWMLYHNLYGGSKCCSQLWALFLQVFHPLTPQTKHIPPMLPLHSWLFIKFEWSLIPRSHPNWQYQSYENSDKNKKTSQKHLKTRLDWIKNIFNQSPLLFLRRPQWSKSVMYGNGGIGKSCISPVLGTRGGGKKKENMFETER